MNLFRKIKRLLNFERILQKKQQEILFNMRTEYLTQCALKDTTAGISDARIADHEVIVSLTTFGKRFLEVYLAIESIMQGSLKPNRIILWVSDELKDKKLPILLQNQMKRGLEIEFCKDIRSYTKLIPCLHKYPDSIIVTIDDDILYDTDMLEKLIAAHLETPEHIMANRVHRVRKDSNGQPLPYLQWEWESKTEGTSSLNFLTGVGGVLYPPHTFDDEVFREDIFLDICKFADDVWFYAMALKANRKIRKIHTHKPNSQEYLENPMVQDTGLYNTNVCNSQASNDIQLKAVLSKYDLYSKLQD